MFLILWRDRGSPNGLHKEINMNRLPKSHEKNTAQE